MRRLAASRSARGQVKDPSRSSRLIRRPDSAGKSIRKGSPGGAGAVLDQHRSPVPDLSNLGRFDLIYMDPPWRYNFSRSRSRRIENHYPTMSLAELQAMDVAQVAAKNCVLLMWTTGPKLNEAMRLIEAWGFTYKTNACWDKGRIGMGYYFRIKHEMLLLATRGRPPLPPPSARVSSIISARRSNEHSRKPSVVYEIIEDMYPRASRIELFARGHARPGWTFWGNEAIPSGAEDVNNSRARKQRCNATPNTRLKRNRSS